MKITASEIMNKSKRKERIKSRKVVTSSALITCCFTAATVSMRMYLYLGAGQNQLMKIIGINHFKEKRAFAPNCGIFFLKA